MLNAAEINIEIADNKNKVLDLQALSKVDGGLDSWSTTSYCCTNVGDDEWSTTSNGCR